MGLVRLLILPPGASRDADGRGIGDDWQLASLGRDVDGTRYYLTTDRVSSSRRADLPCLDSKGLGEWIVERINAAAEGCCQTAPRWRSVADDLPPIRTWVLGWVDQHVDMLQYLGGSTWTSWWLNPQPPPTHWMPLPEGPEEAR